MALEASQDDNAATDSAWDTNVTTYLQDQTGVPAGAKHLELCKDACTHAQQPSVMMQQKYSADVGLSTGPSCIEACMTALGYVAGNSTACQPAERLKYVYS